MWLKGIWTGWLRPYLSLLAGVLLKEGGRRLAMIAGAVVSEIATSGLDNAEKRRVAMGRIEDQLKREGYAFGQSAISLAVELAVQQLKKGA